ncbi:sugar ABC transporter ATP-binding protein [Aureimonas endophytica]|uniref:Sugar ABC transporter ATP-binding protein n=1 Tax=Aureimonas endophytica TaxID=2027858 RepID=A0A916ZHT0_9HYPH|nr:sugar ABC transporter ATP-binding protein [Aureimonas endophytica]GGD97878.1 sugar ABC transporter ATP-binding protein [Aureimonas endophytica]
MPSEHPLLRVSGVSKSFLGIAALSDIDLTLQRGEIHALLGENGAGKSTLIKIITGVYRRDGGEIALEGRPIDPRHVEEAQALGIGTVYQEVNLLPNLSVAENLLLGREPRRFGLTDIRRMRKMTREILARYGLDLDPATPLAAHSVAVQQLVAIARAVELSGKVLILDEPTASLDAAEVARLFGVMRALRDQGLAIVFITHFLDQVFAVADRVTVLRNGRGVGSRDIAGLSRLDIVKMMLGRELKEETLAEARAAPVAAGEPEIRFRGFGRRTSVKPFDLGIRRGEVVGIAGLLGSGRTETARLLFGVDRADSGEASVDGRTVALNSPRDAIAAGFGFCPEERKTDGIIADLSVRENLVLALQARRGWTKPLSRAEQVELTDRYIRALDIRTSDREKPIKFLSGGNQQKVLLARWLVTHPRFLILDEPTRGIDVGAHAEIIRLIKELCDEGMALLVISSELEELAAYSRRIVVCSERAHVAELVGEAVTPDRIMAAIAAPEAKEAAL